MKSFSKNNNCLFIYLIIYMVLQSTGAISLADLQTEFGGANPIDFSEYYLNATTGYTSGVSGIPNIGSAISLNQFYTKAKEYMTAGNMGGNMSITGGTILSAITNVDDLATSIGPIGFPFFFFGTDYATANTIFWSTNQVLHFGTSRNNITWSATTGIGILLGNADRRTNSVYTFANTTVNGYNIKRLTIDHANSYSIAGSEIKMELRLIRGPIYQYIELRMNQWTAATAGTWNLTNGSTFLNIFSTAPPITTGKSLVLRSDLNGNNWTLYNQYYVNL